MQLYHPRPEYVNSPFGHRKPTGNTTARRAGLRYEDHATAWCGIWAVQRGYAPNSGPWIRYTDPAGQIAHAQPDLILLRPETHTGIIVECKHRHTRDCVPQLRKYKMLLGFLHPGYSFSCLEVCKHFDIAEYPMPLFTEPAEHTHEIAAVLWSH